MYLIHVYPLLKGAAPYSLTYFSRTTYQRGACVQIPVRSKQTLGIVHKVESLQSAKSRVKSAPHTLSKLKKQQAFFPFTQPLIRAVEALAEQSFTAPGPIFELLLPKTVVGVATQIKERRPSVRTRHTHYVIQTPIDEQLLHLRTLIREQFARKSSVIIIADSRYATMFLREALAPGIDESRLITLHGGLTQKNIASEWARGVVTKTPVVIIASPTYLAVPRTDIGALVVTEESSPRYRRDVRPLIDMRDCTLLYARALSVPLVSVDTIVRPATIEHVEEGRASEYTPMVWGVRRDIPLTLSDMRSENDPILSSALLDAVGRVKTHGEHVCIFSGRKGIASSVICGDCATPVQCARCEAPLTLTGPSADITAPRLLCRRCGLSRDSHERCRICSSWRLVALGAGSERYEAELKKRFPKTPVLRIDADTASTDLRLRALIKQSRSEPSVVIVTERALPFLSQQYNSVVIGSIDSLLSLPEYNASEKALRIVTSLYAKAEHTCVLQTRMPGHPLVQALSRNAVHSFVQEERALRKVLHFPPYATLVQITRTGLKAAVQRDMASLIHTLGNQFLTYLTPYQNRATRGSLLTIILNSPEEIESLRPHMAKLSPQFSVRVINE